MMNPRCPRCGAHTISNLEWTTGGAVLRYWCPRCNIEVKAPETSATYKTELRYKPAVSNKTEVTP